MPEPTKEYQELVAQVSKDVSERITKDLTLSDTKMKEMVEKAIDEHEKARRASGYKERDFIPAATMASKSEDFAKAWKSGELIKAIHTKDAGVLTKFGSWSTKALGEATGATGGFLLYDEFRPEVQRLIIEDQIVRKYARIIPMAMETILVPRIVDTSHAASIHGGVKGEWSKEADTIGQNDPAFGQIRLIAKKFDNMVKISNELLMDSPISVVPLVEQLLREGIGFFEDAAFFNGSGAGQPAGVLKSPALISVTRASASHIVYQDAITMYSRLFPSSVGRAVWVISPAAIPEVYQFSIAVGTGGAPVMVANVVGQTAAQSPAMFLLGRPVLVSEKVPTLGTSGDIGLYDFGYYLIGDRMALALTTSDQRYFETDQTAFRVIERLDGQSWINSALTPYNGGATLSAFVVLS